MTRPSNEAIESARARFALRKRAVIRDVVHAVESAGGLTSEQRRQLHVTLGAFADAVLASLHDARAAQTLTLDWHVPARLPPRRMLHALQHLATRAWAAMADGTDQHELSGMIALADPFFAGFRRLESRVEDAHQERLTGGFDDLEGRMAVARALVRGEPPPAAADGRPILTSPQYTVSVVVFDQLDESSLYSAARRLIGTRAGRHVLPLPGADELVLLAPQDLERADTHRADAGALLDGLGFAEHPPAGLTAAAAGEVAAAVSEARMVARIARDLGHRTGTFVLDDVWMRALLVRSPDLAERLAERVAPLAAGDGYLLETVRVYLRGGRRRVDTASQLHIHPNTLDYRLKRIRELTGLSTISASDVETLNAALAAWSLAESRLLRAVPSGRRG